jgi:hypothetical protein
LSPQEVEVVSSSISSLEPPTVGGKRKYKNFKTTRKYGVKIRKTRSKVSKLNV